LLLTLNVEIFFRIITSLTIMLIFYFVSLTLILTACGVDLKIHLIVNENKPGMPKSKIKNASQNIFLKYFLVTEVFDKKVIFNVLLMIITSVASVFIEQFFRVPEEAPPMPPPPNCCAGGGGEVDLFIP
jgi:hypothetical protein